MPATMPAATAAINVLVATPAFRIRCPGTRNCRAAPATAITVTAARTLQPEPRSLGDRPDQHAGPHEQKSWKNWNDNSEESYHHQNGGHSDDHVPTVSRSVIILSTAGTARVRSPARITARCLTLRCVGAETHR